MPRILVEPEYLRTISARWQQQATDLRATLGQLSSAFGSLDWEVRQEAGVEGEWQSARSRAEALAGQAEVFSRYLVSKAEAFAEADDTGVAAIGQVAGMHTSAHKEWLDWWKQVEPILTFPESLMRWLLRLGMILDESPIAWLVAPVAGVSGLSVVLRSLRPIASIWQGRVEKAASGLATAPVVSTGSGAALPPATLRPADPADYSSCALYVQARRPDLGTTGGDGGAYNYIEKYQGTAHSYRLPAGTTGGDLRTTPLRAGSVVVWDRSVSGADPQWGHVAIIEDVGPDYIEVSEAGWGSGTRRRIPADLLPDLQFIL